MAAISEKQHLTLLYTVILNHYKALNLTILKNSQKFNIFDLMGECPITPATTAPTFTFIESSAIIKNCPWRKMLWLTVFEIIALKWILEKPKNFVFASPIWQHLKWKHTWENVTAAQNFTLIGCSVAEKSVTEQTKKTKEVTANNIPMPYYAWWVNQWTTTALLLHASEFFP